MASWLDAFGFTIRDKSNGSQIPSVVPPNKNDGSLVVDTSVVSGGWQGYAYDIDSVAKTENEQIRLYRATAGYTEVDAAINDIIDECVVSDQSDYPVKLELDNLKISAGLKEKFQISFTEILDKLDFNLEGHDIFRKWYIDGKIYYHILFNNNDIKQGIAELRPVDPMKIKKIRNIKKKNNGNGVEIVESIEEYYIYNDKGISETALQGVKLSADSVVMSHSGNVDNFGIVTGFLSKAIKPANQLKMLEDAIIIYTITRAPDRRVFYVDVGNLPKIKAEQYVTDVMNKFKNKLVYNAVTGEIADAKRGISMIEDFWMPRRDGCFSLDTKVKLLDGRDVSIAELTTEFNSGKENWTYSVAPDGTIVPGLITWAGTTKKNAKVIDVYLDNGEVITCTPEHKFILRTGEKIEAKDMGPGTILMPINIENRKLYSNKDYSYIQDNATDNWSSVHRMIADYCITQDKNSVIHHINLNRFYNTPSNIMLADEQDQSELYMAPAAEIITAKAQYPTSNSNRQVVKVVERDDLIDVGTLTVDGDNLYHDYHNYALTSGVFVMNSKGTEITTLPGSQSLIQSDFVLYFQNKLYQSLNVPIGRMKPETGFTIGRSSEVTREELKFGKFIGRLRVRFSSLFHDLLRVQLIAKGLIRADEWDDIKSKIRYDFIRDNHFTELKETELLTNRLQTLQQIDQYLGKYYSKAWIMKNVLMMTDDKVIDMEKEIKAEGETALPTELTNQLSMMKIQQSDQPEEVNTDEIKQNQEIHDQKIQHNDELHQQRMTQTKGTKQ